VKNILILAMMLVTSSIAHADNLYVSFKWVDKDAKAYTDSWIIINTKYDTTTANGMVLLSEELAALKNTKAVVIYYVRQLKTVEPTNNKNGGDIRV